MKYIYDQSPVSDLLAVKIGEEISYKNQSGAITHIDFEESNTFWEIIFTLISNEKIYIRKQKNTC